MRILSPFTTITALHVILATALTIVLIAVGAKAADIYHLPFIHAWALMHGTIFVIFPFYFLLSFVAIRPIVSQLYTRYSQGAQSHTGKLSQLAIWSLLLSGTGFLIPAVGSVAGVVLGHLARRRIRLQPQLSGSGVALAGLVLGYLGIAFSLYMLGMVIWASVANGS
jgi:hypothetical protein